MTPEDAVRAIKDRATAVLSYRWLSDLHPDPNGFHMVAVRKALTSLVRTRAIRALFMDFLSCPQKDAQGQRTATEAAVFDLAKETMSHFYASPRTLVLQHKRLPPGFTGYSYDQSGWCNFEQAVARLGQARDSTPSGASRLLAVMKKPVLLVLLLVLLVLLLALLVLQLVPATNLPCQSIITPPAQRCCSNYGIGCSFQPQRRSQRGRGCLLRQRGRVRVGQRRSSTLGDGLQALDKDQAQMAIEPGGDKGFGVGFGG